MAHGLAAKMPGRRWTPMPVLPRFSLCAVFCATSLLALGCNAILGINEPEEGPWVTYPDCSTSADQAICRWGDRYDGDAAPPDVDDASVDDAQRDAPPSLPEASIDASPPIVDSAIERRPDAPAIVDARAEPLPCLFHLPDGGPLCGLGCALLCPLKNACGRDADCASGSCYAGLCTMAYCLNKTRDGDESDVDCGGSCAFTCAAGQKCNNTRDCATGLCSAGICQARTQDASVDAPRGNDANASDVNIGADTADVSRGSDASDVVVGPDAASGSEPAPDAPIVIVDGEAPTEAN